MWRKSLHFKTQHAHGGYEAHAHDVRTTMAQTVMSTITIRNQHLNDIMRMANIIARYAASTLHVPSRIAKKHGQISQTAKTERRI